MTSLFEPLTVLTQMHLGNVAVFPDVISVLGAFFAGLGLSFIISKQLNHTNRSLVDVKANLEKKLQVRSNFLSTMSHEIRTPNNVVMNCSHFIETYLNDIKQMIDDVKQHPNDHALMTTLNEKMNIVMDSARRIKQSSYRQAYLLNNILDISKLEEDKMLFDMQKNNLQDIIMTAIEENRGLYENIKDIKIVVIPPVINTDLVCDLGRMLQVIMNLLSNAIKYSENGTITISISEPNYTDVPSLQCAIADEGIGIPKDELTAIFEKFTESSYTKKRSAGTGIGLAICNEIVSAHHGKIWAENRPEKGSVFYVVIPRAQTL